LLLDTGPDDCCFWIQGPMTVAIEYRSW